MVMKKNEIGNNSETSFLNIKILLGALLTLTIIGGLGYYFANNKKPSEESAQEVIEENDNQEIIENEETEKQEEVIVNNEYTFDDEYIPIIDITWLSYLISPIIFVVCFIMITRVPFSLFVVCHKCITYDSPLGGKFHLQRTIDASGEHPVKVGFYNFFVCCVHYFIYLFLCFLIHFIISLIGSGIAKFKSSLSYGHILMHALFKAPTLRGWHIIWNLFFVILSFVIFLLYFLVSDPVKRKKLNFGLFYGNKGFYSAAYQKPAYEGGAGGAGAGNEAGNENHNNTSPVQTEIIN